jgi:Tfp pilus assembly protein PilN
MKKSAAAAKNDNINSLENSLKNQDKQLSEIDKLQKTEQFEFKDQQNVKDFVERP